MKHVLSIIVTLLVMATGNEVFAFPKDGLRASDPEQVGAKSINIQKHNDILTIYSILNGRNNRVEVYTITYGADEWQLAPFATFEENGNNYYETSIPAQAAVIVNPEGDTPSLKVGSRQISLVEGASRKLNYQRLEGFEAYRDYLENPAEYPAIEGNPCLDIDRMQELVRAYANIHGNIRLAKRNQESRRYAANTQRALIPLGVLFVLFIVGLVIKFRITGFKMAAGFANNIRNIAIVEISLSVVMVTTVCMCYETNWPVIVAAVILIICIQILNLFQGIDVISHLKYANNGKFPWLPAIVFSYVTIIAILQLISIVIGLIVAGVDTDHFLTENLIGMILGIVICLLCGWWYSKSLTKNAPQLRNSFGWIAVVTLMLASAVLILSLAIIVLVIVKGVGKSFLLSGETASKAENAGVGHDCFHCYHITSGGGCSIYNEFDKPAFNCPHYNPIR